MSAPRQISDYLDRVTSRWRSQPKFMGELTLLLQPFVDAQTVLGSLPAAFCLDTAVGVQLDATGAWVGVSRAVPVPIPNIYFSWDDLLRGWDRGVWRGPYADPTALTLLDDDTYRTVLYARAEANDWDGTVEQAQEILNAAFPDPTTHVMYLEVLQSAEPSRFFTWDAPEPQPPLVGSGWDEGIWYQVGDESATVEDTQPAVVIAVSGMLPPVVLLFVLEQNLIPLRPAGVPIEYVFTSVNGSPLFAWDVENEKLAGWDTGTWGVDATFVLNNVSTGGGTSNSDFGPVLVSDDASSYLASDDASSYLGV